MKNVKQIKEGEIGTGISYEMHKAKAQEIFDTVVKPQLDEDSFENNSDEKIVLSPVQKIYSNCQNPI